MDRATQIAQQLEPHLEPGQRVLEIGAGDGRVAETLQRRTGAQFTLVDVVDYNQSRLPCTTYDGSHLPFPDRSFDSAMLIFVLHHAADPLPVLREALRVSRQDVLICENHVAGWWRKPVTRIVDSLPHLRYGVPVCYRTLSIDEWHALLAPLPARIERLGRYSMGRGFWQNFTLRLSPRK